ncbi:MAG TPA: hypothetical protein VGQ83_41715, partial [Polyangia bacterium]
MRARSVGVVAAAIAATLAAAAPARAACPVYTQAQCQAGIVTNCPAAGPAVTCIVSGWDPTPANRTKTLGGRVVYKEVCVVCGGTIAVTPFDNVAANKSTKGNLELVAEEIYVDNNWNAGVTNFTGGSCTLATSNDCWFGTTCLNFTGNRRCHIKSNVTALGAGYPAKLCGDGPGPAAATGGRGGCSLRDSGGGGGHFGGGGRGTVDCPGGVCTFPHDWEEDCGNTLNATGTACTDTTDCRDHNALPTVAGQPYRHSIWAVEFGAAGGDKGCRDNDGFPSGAWPQCVQAGPGGGRIVLVGHNAGGTGIVKIEGRVIADGRGGCGAGNDSAGGGAGGTVLIVGDLVTIAPGAVDPTIPPMVSAAGGQGGDTQGLTANPPRRDCPNVGFTADCTPQQGGTCDDCAGGGGGGVISIMSRSSVATLGETVQFNVGGAKGGVCASCTGEAGG